jgi:hypothetical protein
MEKDVNIQEELTKPFKAEEIEWRVQRSGKGKNGVWALVLAYVDARACMNRLDKVFGVTGWQVKYEHRKDGVICTLSIWDKEKQMWIEKQDGSPETDFEAFKGGISKAFVRACNTVGIGRYLYNLPATFADIKENGKNKDAYKNKDTKEEIWFKWDEPKLPEWATPKEEKQNDK